MSGLPAVVVTACSAAVICSLLSVFLTDSGLRRVLSLVMGAFLVCAMVIPVSRAVTELRPETELRQSYDELTATADEAFSAQVVKQAEKNLESALMAIAEQSGITLRDCEIILAESENGSIIISQISIYIDQSESGRTGELADLVKQHFGIAPRVITE